MNIMFIKAYNIGKFCNNFTAQTTYIQFSSHGEP